MAVYNDKQNLKALEELKALGVNDLSPAAILEMIQQHAKMEQKQSKELNKTQKELDKTREDVKNLKEENDRITVLNTNLESILKNCINEIKDAQIGYHELFHEDRIPNISISEIDELNKYFLDVVKQFIFYTENQSSYIRGAMKNGGSEKTIPSTPSAEDSDDGDESTNEPGKIVVDEVSCDTTEAETQDIIDDGDIEATVNNTEISANGNVNAANPTIKDGSLKNVDDAFSKVNDEVLKDIDLDVDGETGDASVVNDENIVTPVEQQKSNSVLKIKEGSEITNYCCNCQSAQKMRITSVVARFNELMVKMNANVATANISVGRAKCMNCGQQNEINPAEFVPIERFEAPGAKADTTVIHKGSVVTSDKPQSSPDVTELEEIANNIANQEIKQSKLYKPSSNLDRVQTLTQRKQESLNIFSADTVIKSTINFEDFLVEDENGNRAISPRYMRDINDGSYLPTFKKSQVANGLAADMCAWNSVLTVPKSRIAKYMQGCGCSFTTQNIINIINGFSRAFCAPVAKEILKDLLSKNKTAIMDETTVNVRENTSATKHHSYIWAVHNGHSEDVKASYFMVSDSRSFSNVVNIIEEVGLGKITVDSLISDGFTAYQKAMRHLNQKGYKISLARCYCHARRPIHKLLRDSKLLEIYEKYLLPIGSKFSDFKANFDKYIKDSEAKGSKLRQIPPIYQDLIKIYHLINTLFVIESGVVRKHNFNYTSDNFIEDLRKVRKTKSAPVVDAIFDSVKLCILNHKNVINTNVTTTKDGKTKVTYNRKNLTTCAPGRALMYLLKYENDLREFVTNPRIDLSSNAVERSLRLGVCAKKSFEFLDSMDGAHSFCNYMTIVNTCMQNNVPVRNYFMWLIMNMKYRISQWIAEDHKDEEINDSLYKIPKRKAITGADGKKEYISMYDKRQRLCYDVISVKGLTPYDYRNLILKEKAESAKAK